MTTGNTSTVVGFSVPPELAKEVNALAKREQRTKSELFREMVRVYKRYRKQREREEEQWVMNLISEVEEEKRTNPKSPEELKAESIKLAQYGAKRAKERGYDSLTDDDIDRIIHEFRAEQRA